MQCRSYSGKLSSSSTDRPPSPLLPLRLQIQFPLGVVWPLTRSGGRRGSAGADKAAEADRERRGEGDVRTAPAGSGYSLVLNAIRALARIKSSGLESWWACAKRNQAASRRGSDRISALLRGNLQEKIGRIQGECEQLLRAKLPDYLIGAFKVETALSCCGHCSRHTTGF